MFIATAIWEHFTEDPPGNVRPWYLAGNQDAPYSFKIVQWPPNACVSRQRYGVQLFADGKLPPRDSPNSCMSMAAFIPFRMILICSLQEHRHGRWGEAIAEQP